MITGYNTDVRYKDWVVHVQTEDKGLANPCIESLIYVGGQVLAAKRSNYNDLIESGGGEKAISDAMARQHKLMIVAIEKGKFDGKLEALGAPRSKSAATAPAKTNEVGLLEQGREDSGPTLDQVILDYLTAEAKQEQLQLLLDDEAVLDPGGSGLLALRAASSKNGLPVAGVQVSVKMISTVHEPRQLGNGVTDDEGQLRLTIDIPVVQGGAAALIVTASSVIGRAELKHLL
jgi:hypothetical protein